jgi:hypothetical protein
LSLLKADKDDCADTVVACAHRDYDQPDSQRRFRALLLLMQPTAAIHAIEITPPDR